MAQQTQKQEHDNLHRDGQRHPFPLWVRWFIVLFVPLVVIVGTILWIIQGAQAIIPIAVLSALGILIAFSQVLPWLFPSIKQEQSTIPSDIGGISQDLTRTRIQLPEQATKEIHTSESKVDWGEAPHISQFYGRD